MRHAWLAVLTSIAILTGASACGSSSSSPSTTAAATKTAQTVAERERAAAKVRHDFCASDDGRALLQTNEDFTAAVNYSKERSALRVRKEALRLSRNAPRGASCAYATFSQIVFVLTSAQNNLPNLDVDDLRGRTEAFQKEHGFDQDML